MEKTTRTKTGLNMKITCPARSINNSYNVGKNIQKEEASTVAVAPTRLPARLACGGEMKDGYQKSSTY
jgi:hypothetical protein